MANPKEVRIYQPQIELDLSLTPEWPVQDIEKADAEVSQAARAIRLHYYRQLPLLRQIPYLALEANGRGGWLDEWSRAYGHCMMAIHQKNKIAPGVGGGSYDMFIELRSGVLIGASGSSSHYVITASETVQFGGDTSWNLASDKEIYTMLAHQDDGLRFNPADQIRYMQERSKNPYHNRPEDVERALRDKARYKEELDAMMAALPEEQVVETLRAQGFDL